MRGAVFFGVTVLFSALTTQSVHAADTVTVTGKVTYPDGSLVESGFVLVDVEIPVTPGDNLMTRVTNGKYSIQLPTNQVLSLEAGAVSSDRYQSDLLMMFPTGTTSANLNFIVNRPRGQYHLAGYLDFVPGEKLTRTFDRLGEWSLPAGALPDTTALDVRFGQDLPKSVSSRIIVGTTLQVTARNNDALRDLNAPLHLSLPIATLRLKALQLKASDVELAEYSPTTKRWTSLPTTAVNSGTTSTNPGTTYSTDVDHFGVFALISKKTIAHETFTTVPVAPYGTIKVLDRVKKETARFMPYGKTYHGKFLVTTGDLNGDNTDEIVTLQVTPSDPILKVFRSNGQLISSRMIKTTGHGLAKAITIKDKDGNGSIDVAIAWTNDVNVGQVYALYPNTLYQSQNSPALADPSHYLSPNVYGK